MKLPKQWSHWLRKNKMKDMSAKCVAKTFNQLVEEYEAEYTEEEKANTDLW